MGLDLTLAPIRFHKDMTWWLATETLSVDRDGLGHAIAGRDEELNCDLDPKPLPDGIRFDWYGDEGIERTTQDAYGDELEYVLAGDLAKELKRISKKTRFSPWNQAVVAFVCALPKDVPIVLWWH